MYYTCNVCKVYNMYNRCNVYNMCKVLIIISIIMDYKYYVCCCVGPNCCINPRSTLTLVKVVFLVTPLCLTLYWSPITLDPPLWPSSPLLSAEDSCLT